MKSQRDNLILGGIDEVSTEDCNAIAIQIFKDKFKIPNPENIQRAHRLGKREKIHPDLDPSSLNFSTFLTE